MKPSLTKPPKLQEGDKVATVSLSWGGPGLIPHRYEAGKKQLEEAFGLVVIEMPHTLKEPKWLFENPKARADDLMEAFSNSEIKGIISTIGGDDSIRILRHLDLDLIRKNPKPFVGYSDTTISHFACLKAGIVSFYGPAIMAGFAENGGLFPYMVNSVRRTLFDSGNIGEIPENRDGWTVERLDWANPANQKRKRTLQGSAGWQYLQGEGQAEGHLIGGCLEVLDWIRSTDVWPNKEVWEGAILFIETSEETPPPSTVTRFFRSLAAMDILPSLSGILFGRPGGHELSPDSFHAYDDAILQIVADEEGLTSLPIITQMDFGHTDPMFVLPYGIQAEIDSDWRKFTILENAVESD